MKSFAKEAVLISGDSSDGLKTYRVTWVNKQGEAHTDFSKGVDMKTALDSVLRTKDLEKVSNLPEWVWFLGYSLFIGTYAVAATCLNKPLLILLGCFTLLLAVKLVFDRYFRYVK
tara:strand:- start:321 stop:665 length:345 start_codon:yes stop_codon:yes gene_type:complete